MNAKKRTPGPWRVGLRPGPMVYGPNGEQVADCRFDNGDDNKANARLLAASWELHAELTATEYNLTQMLCALGEKALPDSARSMITDIRNRNRALLARIEGTTP